MSLHIGREQAVGLSIEGTRGTAEATASKWLKKTSATLLPQVEKVVDDSSFGRLEDAEKTRVVREWYEGEIGGVLHADAIGYVLAQMYGTQTSNEIGVDSGVYEHEFTLEQSIEHPTLSVFVADPVKSEVYNSGVISTLAIEATTDDFVRNTINVLAQTFATHSDTVSYDTEYDFIGKDITIKMASTAALLASAVAVPAKNININFDTGAISDWVFGSNNPNLYNGSFAIEFDFTKNYKDSSFMDLYKSDEAKYFEISIKGDTVLPESNRPELTFTFNRVQVTDYELDDDSNALREESITCKAFYNVADNQQSKALLRNLTASY